MRHAVIWGRRRQGKSTLALALAAATGERPILVFDSCDQYSSLMRIEIEELEEVLIEELDAIRVVPDDVPLDFAALMDVLDGGSWRWSDYTLILDEASSLQRPQAMEPGLARLIRQAPDDVTVIQTLHRPSETHSTVRALATDVFLFQTYLTRDLKVIEDQWGSEVAVEVRRLPDYHVLHFWVELGGKPAWKIWTDPELWYIPIQEGGDKMITRENELPESAEEQIKATEPVAEPAVEPARKFDPVEELIRGKDEEIERLRKRAAKLEKRLESAEEKKSLDKPVEPASIQIREESRPDLLNWLAGDE